MFGWNPAIDLSQVKDEISDKTCGFSFVQHPPNNLGKAYLGLISRACETGRRSLYQHGRWDFAAIFRYRQSVHALLDVMLGMFTTTGGQMPRSTELFLIEHKNTATTKRGIYVYNGSMIYLTRHHKAKRLSNQEFNVARFLV